MMARSPEVLPRRRFDIDDVERMTRAGIFPDDERIELIDGEVVEVPVPSSRHAALVARLGHILVERCERRAVLWVQNPILFDRHNFFLPDLALLRAEPDFYRASYPTPDAVLLAIEVADSSLRRDRDAKLPVYARCGVRELWIVELRRQRIHAFLEPKDGRYLRTRVCTNDDRLTIASGGEIRMREIFC